MRRDAIEVFRFAYAGRWADGALPEDTPRYLLPKGFEKSPVLFSRKQAQVSTMPLSSSRAIGRCCDCTLLACRSWPVSATACCRSKSTFARAVLIFDGDEGGRKDTEQVLPVLATRLVVKALMLGDGVKPDTLSDTLVADLPRYGR